LLEFRNQFISTDTKKVYGRKKERKKKERNASCECKQMNSKRYDAKITILVAAFTEPHYPTK
jgi:hypothetical protein